MLFGCCSDVVRTLFGSSLGMFGCTQEKSEQSPNKVRINTGTRPDRCRIPVEWSAGKKTCFDQFPVARKVIRKKEPRTKSQNKKDNSCSPYCVQLSYKQEGPY